MRQIDAVVWGVIEAASYGDAFIAHEGIVFSIKAGIYLPRDVGIRIEDLVIATADGCEVLTHYPKSLQIISQSLTRAMLRHTYRNFLHDYWYIPRGNKI